MNPLQITITPTMICFKELPDYMANKFHDEYGLLWNDKSREYYITSDPANLYKIILSLSYEYDIEVN